MRPMTESSAAQRFYRPDIDGLRAIALIMIVLFHLQPGWLPAGFIGVDVFFVISGYLITRIIVSGERGARFTYAGFYRNRIKRIVPVLCVVVAVVLALGNLVLLPEDLDRLAWSAMFSQLFLGNVYFNYFLDTSYFAKASATEPLLHLWSLGVEEQFYLLWPLFLVLGLRHLRTGIFCVLLTIVGLASFIFGELYFHSDPMFVFYMLPARAGELIVGALCFFLLQARPSGFPRLGPWLSALGLALLFGSVVIIDETTRFPGFNAIPVTLGAALVVLGGHAPNPVARLLGNPLMVWVGLHSYSLYLWHWPVIEYYKYVFGVPGLAPSLALVGLMIVLSVATYRWVETPFRSTGDGFRLVFLKQLVAPTAALLLLCGVLIGSGGLGTWAFSEDYQRALKQERQQVRKAPKSDFICQAPTIDEALLKRPACAIGSAEEPTVLLWGDSKASHYVPALRVVADHYGFAFRNVAAGSCPPVLDNPAAYTLLKAWKSCNESIDYLAPRLARYDTILMSANWEDYLRAGPGDFDRALAETIRSLVAQGSEVIVLGNSPRFPDYDRRCAMKALKLPFMDCDERFRVPSAPVAELAARVRKIAREEGARYLDFNRYLCAGESCSAQLEGKLAYFDRGHLSLAGSAALGRAIRDSGQGRAWFRSLRTDR